MNRAEMMMRELHALPSRNRMPRQRASRQTTGGQRDSLCTAATFAIEVDANKMLSTLEGRAAPYGTWTNRGYYLESFADGLFAKSTKEAARLLPLLLWHEQASFPIGKSRGWSSQNDGLYGKWDLDKSPMAQEAARLARDGFMMYMSVGYGPTLSRWDLAEDTLDYMDGGEGSFYVDENNLSRCTRLEARLIEVSLTPTPAFEDAEVVHVASTGRPPLVLPSQSRHAGSLATPKFDAWTAWRASMTQ